MAARDGGQRDAQLPVSRFSSLARPSLAAHRHVVAHHLLQLAHPAQRLPVGLHDLRPPVVWRRIQVYVKAPHAKAPNCVHGCALLGA